MGVKDNLFENYLVKKTTPPPRKRKQNIDLDGTIHNRAIESKKSRRRSTYNPAYFNMRSMDEEINKLFLLYSLEHNDICVLDNFLDQQLASRISKTTRYLYHSLPGLFTESVPAARTDTTTRYRNDVSCWLQGTEQHCNSYSELSSMFTILTKGLVKQYQSTHKRLRISQKSKLQLSCYPAGCNGYRPHIDNPNNNGRVLTLVYYPNEGYQRSQHGGVSKFCVKNKTRCIDVEPKNNRLVIYWSDRRVITETLPSHANVFSLSCWYFGHEQIRE